jgi:hypothetical protein
MTGTVPPVGHQPPSGNYGAVFDSDSVALPTSPSVVVILDP